MDIHNFMIKPEQSIKEALQMIGENARKFIMVTENKKLLGVVTDGDVRRWILKNEDLSLPVSMIMNDSPITLMKNEMHRAEELMKEHLVSAIPILDNRSEVVSLITWQDIQSEYNVYSKIDAPVVIMAGGKGERLYPYTRIIPKPLIPIGDEPIIERIMNEFANYQVNEFYLTVNYKKNMIKNYFIDELTQYRVHFIEEEDYYGTAGSLRYLDNQFNKPFFLSNCDILIKADYEDILHFHIKQNNAITVVASMKNIKIPYGVIKIGNNEEITNIEEKPEYDILVNTGMYVLNPEVIKLIPENTVYHMTDLIDYCIQNEIRIGTYPISEHAWLDMGQIKEMEEMIRKLTI